MNELPDSLPDGLPGELAASILRALFNAWQEGWAARDNYGADSDQAGYGTRENPYRTQS